ncbi:MAG: alkaline phosphatase family protein [Ignavibacteria bacterium]|nr:alkaline phosphatase family protein [Ignavibacteria bacterium]
MNKIAEKISKSLFNSGFVRIITRPFTGEPGNFIRNESERKDFLLVNIPPSSLIGDLIDQGVSVRLTKHLNRILNYPKGANILQDQYNNNKELFSLISSDTQNGFDMQFYVIPDTDNFGHKKNLEGFANSLIGIDNWLQKYVEMLKDNDLLIITADHGCDPTVNLRGHCREYVPLLIYNKKTTNSVNIGVRNTFSDIGQTIAFNFNLPPLTNGKIIYEIF